MTHDIPNVLKKNYERDKRSGVIPGVEFTFGSCLTEANINIDIYQNACALDRTCDT